MRGLGAKQLLRLIPEPSIHDWLMLTRMPDLPVPDLTEVDRAGEQFVERAAAERLSAGPKEASRTAVRGRSYTRPNGWNEWNAQSRSALSCSNSYASKVAGRAQVLRFEDSRFLIMFYIKQAVPLDLRERFQKSVR